MTSKAGAHVKVGKKLFVGGLSARIDDRTMRTYFQKFGDLTDCVVMKDGQGKSRGFGFVQYAKKESAMRCFQSNGSHFLDGRSMEVKPADGEDKKPAEVAKSTSPAPRSRSRSTPSCMRRRRKSTSSERVKSKERSRSKRKKAKSKSKSKSKSNSSSRGRKAKRKQDSSSGSSSSSSQRKRKSPSRRKKSRSGSAAAAPASKGDAADDDEEEVEIDIQLERADMRRANASTMLKIDDLPVKREPEGLPEPIGDWQDACDRKYLNDSLVATLRAAGLDKPTAIQRHAIPIIAHEFGKYDLIASAQTGSGKTFAFVIPTIARLVLQGTIPRPFFPGAMAQGCPLLLMLSPTRELAQQTAKEIEVLTKGSKLVNMCVFGGESQKVQIQKIAEGQIDILCATPGRLIDLIDCSKLSLSFVQCVVLDEADQMLDLGLEIMCAEILTGRDMPDPNSGRQTLLFSATMPQKIRDLCPKILREKRIANITVGHYGDNQGGSCSSIKQIVKLVPDENSRIPELIDDLHRLWMRTGNPGQRGKVVIFTNQRIQAGHLATALVKQAGITCAHLHGKLEQQLREEMVEKFRTGKCEVLVATNVAARGLDFADIALVVQFNMPGTIDVYTHRIGRTGRAGQVGCSLTYIGHKDRHLYEKLVHCLQMNKQEVPDFLLPRTSGSGRDNKGSGKGYRGSGKDSYGGRDRGGDRDRDRDRGDRGDRGGGRYGGGDQRDRGRW